MHGNRVREVWLCAAWVCVESQIRLVLIIKKHNKNTTYSRSLNMQCHKICQFFFVQHFIHIRSQPLLSVSSFYIWYGSVSTVQAKWYGSGSRQNATDPAPAPSPVERSPSNPTICSLKCRADSAGSFVCTVRKKLEKFEISIIIQSCGGVTVK